MSGPLTGLRVVEFAGIGPGPFAAMLLSDLGAEVLRIGRPGPFTFPTDVTARGRAWLELDLKSDGAVERCLRILARADVLIEGYRPGVMERLGLGPEPCLAANPRLVYGRMTGWGQEGPLAGAAGHDINYIALAGALEQMRPAEGPPVPPLNLVGDFGGGALYLVLGIVSALYERERSGRGQVIDAAIVDGTASLTAVFHGLRALDSRMGEREGNFLSGAAPHYRCYACKDGGFIAVGALEPQFHALLVEKLGVDPARLGDPRDPAAWPAATEVLAEVFATRTRDDWCALLEGTDACFAPVLGLSEAPDHPHMKARATFEEVFGVVQPAPAPRFSRTPGSIQGPPPAPGHGAAERLAAWGVEEG